MIMDNYAGPSLDRTAKDDGLLPRQHESCFASKLYQRYHLDNYCPSTSTLNQRVQPRAYIVSILDLCFPSSYTFCIRDRLAPSIVSPPDYMFVFCFTNCCTFLLLLFFLATLAFLPSFCALKSHSVLLLLFCFIANGKGR